MRRGRKLLALVYLISAFYFLFVVIFFALSMSKYAAIEGNMPLLLTSSLARSLKLGLLGSALGLFYWVYYCHWNLVSMYLYGPKGIWPALGLLWHCAAVACFMAGFLCVVLALVYWLDGGNDIFKFIVSKLDMYIGIGLFGASLGGVIWLRDRWRRLW
ncbi:hypothetical protein D9M69_505910 [compost metagenome]